MEYVICVTPMVVFSRPSFLTVRHWKTQSCPVNAALTAAQTRNEDKYIAGFPNSANYVEFCYILASLQVPESQ